VLGLSFWGTESALVMFYKTNQWVLGLFPFEDKVRTGYAGGCWDYLFGEQSPHW
jgi:hypothetical protein